MLMPKLTILYWPDDNVFKNPNGECIYPYPLLSADDIYLFKHKKQSVEILNWRLGIIIRLLYPNSSIDDGLYEITQWITGGDI